MASVVLCPYSAEWPNLFQAVREELLVAFSPLEVAIEHIGSTAVPGLVAKPVIDVLVGAPSLPAIESNLKRLRDRGYSYVPKYERELPERRYFVRPPPPGLRVHVHAVERDSRIWREHLVFRHALRSDSDLRSEYQALKLRLAQEFAEDKSAYSAAKAPFIQSVFRRKKEEARQGRGADAEL